VKQSCHEYILTHQAPVVWKLAQVQAAGPRYIRGRHTIYSYFTSNANRWAPGRMFSSIQCDISYKSLASRNIYL